MLLEKSSVSKLALAIFLPLLCTVVLLMLLSEFGPAETAIANNNLSTQSRTTGIESKFAPNRIIVKFRSGVHPKIDKDGIISSDLASLAKLFSAYQVTHDKPLIKNIRFSELSNTHILILQDDVDVIDALIAFSNDPNVEWVEPDYLAYPAETTPNDPQFANQWGLTQIEAPAAWDIITGSQTVSIAILDSGIDMNHSDFSGLLWVNPGEIAGNGQDDDNNGYIDDINGWDFVNDDNDPSDDNGHGTQVAGIAAAATDNGVGIAGVCWNCKIMPVKVMQTSGIANYSDIAAGVLYAARKGAEVINLSMGGYANSLILQTAIQIAVNDYDVVVVGGAGNDNLDAAFYPAAFPEVLAVVGTTITDTKAPLSNYGSWVDVAAPAVNITTTFLGGDWGPANGTSFAAPFAAGLAGLLFSQHPEWSEPLVRAQIEHTVKPIDELNPAYSYKLGSGRINAADAVFTTPHPILMLESTSINGDPQGRPTQGESSTLKIALVNDWLDANGVTGVLTTTDPLVTIDIKTASFGDIHAGEVGENMPAYTFTVDLAAGYNHQIPFSLEVIANNGNYTETLIFTITTRSAEMPVSGTIATDTTWTNDKIYIVNNHIGVPPGVVLTIDAGTEIRFNGIYNLNIGGTLIADGTQTQPIRFSSNTESDWGRIYFDDPSVDASTDVNGTYLTGNILNWVQVKDASDGIDCGSATPYLSRISLDSGGINCTPGGTTLWVLDSQITGGLIIGAGGNVFGNSITGGSVKLSGQSIIQDNTIDGGISTGSNSLVEGNQVGSDINAPGASIVQENVVKNGGISVGPMSMVVQNEIVGGNISVSSDTQVLNNTLRNGGLIVENGSTVSWNDIEGAEGWGISTSGSVTVTYNRVIGGANGIKTSGWLVDHNLVANNSGIGLQIEDNTTVLSNTITANSGSAIKLISATNLLIQGNNLEGNLGLYDIENLISQADLATIPAQSNWWGTIDNITIDARIWDFNDEYNLGQVLYALKQSDPVQNAPAYMRSVSIDPPSPVGIQEVEFEVQFSRPMETNITPELYFHSIKDGNWTVYNSINSDLPFDWVPSIVTDPDGSHWFGTSGRGVAHFDGSNWTIYNRLNSGLPDDNVVAIIVDSDGSHWFGTLFGGVAHFDGLNWKVYNSTNSGLPHNTVRKIATDPDGSHWFVTNGGVAHFDGSTWTVYNTSNSGLPNNILHAISIDPNGSIWFGTDGQGVAYFDRSNWTIYNTSNSGLTNDFVYSIVADSDGSIWMGTGGGGVAKLTGSEWKIYNTSNSELPGNYVHVIHVDSDGSHWFGCGPVAKFDGMNWVIYSMTNSGLPINDVRSINIDSDGSHWFGTDGGGIAKLMISPHFNIVDNPKWLTDDRYQSTYDINTFVSRDIYSLVVQTALGADGIEIAAYSTYTFTVDYTGAIGDTISPMAPIVIACADSSPDTLSAQWTAADLDISITLYRYAIGSTPGGTDVVNWTNTTENSFIRSGLGLISGQTYYISVMARNAGGLWSDASTPPGVVAGSGLCTSTQAFIYLPIMIR